MLSGVFVGFVWSIVGAEDHERTGLVGGSTLESSWRSVPSNRQEGWCGGSKKWAHGDVGATSGCNSKNGAASACVYTTVCVGLDGGVRESAQVGIRAMVAL